MMERLASLPPDWKFAAALIALLLLLLLLLRLRQASRRRLGRLADLESEVRALRDRLDRLESQPPGFTTLDQQVYAEAQRLAREGMDSVDLAGQLGISRGEADLIIALRKAAP